MDLNSENDTSYLIEFTPFEDTNGSGAERIGKAKPITVAATQGYNTKEIDGLRQGVSMRTRRHIYGSVQPKFWSGNNNHYILVRTLGQARSFVEFGNSPLFNDILPTFDTGSVGEENVQADFNPVQYITDPNYPFPIIFNDGPQKQEEAILEPFTINYRLKSIEGPYPARSVKGSLEDGNNFDDDRGATSRIEQFVEYYYSLEPRFFLDEGAYYLGDNIENGIPVEGYTALIQREIIAYNDTKNESIVEQIQTTDSDFISALKALKFDLDGDIREDFNKKSAPAGYDVYGPTSARAGTDSIAYIGTVRGS